MTWALPSTNYDYRTDTLHMLKEMAMHYEHLSDFVNCYNPRNRSKRKAS